MRQLFFSLIAATALLAGCVTINVYFPAAAAQKAAEKFIGNVIGPDTQNAPAQPASGSSSGDGGDHGVPLAARVLDMLVPAASAAETQPDIKIQTPEINAIQTRMHDRFESTLQPLLASGAIGFTRNGDVAVRDASKAPLSQRAQMNSAVADENRDRAAVYQQIAIANGHSEWAARIRETFAKQWIEQAHAGWYYQDVGGAWKQK